MSYIDSLSILGQMTAIGWGAERLYSRNSSGNLKKVPYLHYFWPCLLISNLAYAPGSGEKDFKGQLQEEAILSHQTKKHSIGVIWAISDKLHGLRRG